MLTQCPIPPLTSFQYIFKANRGTHYYHGHSGLQRVDGLYGAVIVREGDSDPHADLYDYDLPENILQVMDWSHEGGREGYSASHHSFGGHVVSAATINGMAHTPYLDPETNQEYYMPRLVFTVEKNKRYRFRVLSNGFINCPMKISIDNHKLTMISSDGQPFEPYEVSSVMVLPGERYDFVVNANHEGQTNHWIRMAAIARCTRGQIQQNSILRYNGAPDENPMAPEDYSIGANKEGIELNPYNRNLSPDKTPVVYMNHTDTEEDTADDKWNKPVADVTHYLSFYVSSVNNPIYNDLLLYPQSDFPDEGPLRFTLINEIALTFPSSPLLTQYDDVPEKLICDEEKLRQQGKRCNETFCKCTHMIQVNYGDVAEIFLIDRGHIRGAMHPFHLHGYSFRVVGMNQINPDGVTAEEIKEMDARGEIPRKLNRAMKKDTVGVPDGGYTILRFHATNPGFWLLHCHLADHLETGMGVIIQVGEVSQMKSKPKNFPTCGDFYQEGYEVIDEEPPKTTPSTATSKTLPSLWFVLLCYTLWRLN